MLRILRAGLVHGLIAAAFWSGGAIHAQTVASAPVPPELTTATRVFISNAGADSGLFPSPFTGAPDRAYNEFYAAIKDWGRYQLVADPASADLVFELQLTAPSGPSDPDKTKGASDPLPMLRLVIFDRKTHYVLWALTESIDHAVGAKAHNRNFDDAIAALTTELKRLTAPSAPATP